MEFYVTAITLVIWCVITGLYTVSFARYTYFLNKTPLTFQYPYRLMKSTKISNTYNNKSLFGIAFFGLIMCTSFIVVTAFAYPLFYILYLRVITQLNNDQVFVFTKLLKLKVTRDV